MWAFGLLCLLATAAALPTPQSSEIANDDESLFTNTLESGKEKSEEKKEDEVESVAIPSPPELEPILAPVFVEIEGAELELKPDVLENKEEKEKESKEEKDEDNKPEDEKPVVVTLEVNKPSFLATLFSNFPQWSWPPSFPSISLPNFTFPSLPFFGGSGGRARMVYPEYYPEIPNYRYVYVK